MGELEPLRPPPPPLATLLEALRAMNRKDKIGLKLGLEKCGKL